MPTTDTPSRDALNGSVWADYLMSVVERDPEAGAHCIGSQQLNVSDSRQLARWTREGVLPSFWTADAFLTRYHLHIDLFFGFAERAELSPWAHSSPPAWHEEDWTHEDINWSDPELDEPEALAA
jgi:hypothetical protein